MSLQIRLVLLNALCLSIWLTLGKIVLDPMAGKRPFADFKFPDAVSLPGWKWVDSQPLIDRASATTPYDRVNAAQQYDYHQHNMRLHVEIRYVLNTNGDVMKLFRQHTPRQLPSEIKQVHTASGSYNTFTLSEQLYLTSCINPRGSSTVTAEQFFHNRYTYDLQFDHLLGWGRGQENLIDQRCMWLTLSTPVQDKNHDRTLSVLEEAWQDLTDWGQVHFPSP